MSIHPVPSSVDRLNGGAPSVAETQRAPIVPALHRAGIGFVNGLPAVLAPHFAPVRGVIQRARISLAGGQRLQEAAAAKAAIELGRAGVTDVSEPSEVKDLPRKLRDALIREMAEQFSRLWGECDSGLKTHGKAIGTLAKMAHDPGVVFRVQYDRQGKLVSTSTIVDRDEPAFRDTGTGGTDRYGDHWVANVFTSPDYRGRGYATAQIKALQGLAAERGWPHLWLYCRDTQDGVELPKYYHDRLGFAKAGEERVEDNGKMEKENIMRFDTHDRSGG